MKRVIIVVGILICLVAPFSTASAGPDTKVGDILKFSDSYGNDGGEYIAKVQSAPFNTWVTFCVERDEFFAFGYEFLVNDVSTVAYAGGINTDTGDPLDARTAYLYSKFRAGTLANYDYSNVANRPASADALQNAIWYLEEEINAGQLTAGGQFYVDLAEAAIASGQWSGLGNVKIVNILWNQDYIVNGQVRYAKGTLAQSLLAVPEPATIVLLGLAFLGAGVGALRRKLSN